MSKKFFLALCFSSLFFLPTLVYAEERIKTFVAHYTINKNGSISVQEEIVYDFGDAQKHGIFRDIPLIFLPPNAQSNSQIELSSISVTDGRGHTREVASEKGGNILSLRIGDPDIFVTGEQFYVIRYTIWGGLQSYINHDEFYWNVTGNGWNVPIDRIRAEVTFSSPIIESKLSRSCYRGLKGSTEKCIRTTLQTNENGIVKTIRFEEDNLGQKEGLTIAVGIPKGEVLFTTNTTQDASSKRTDTTKDIGIQKWWQQPFLDFSLVIPFVVFITMFLLWWERGRDPKGRGTIITQYDPPKDISLLEAGAIYGNDFKTRVFPALLISLAIRGYVEIKREEKEILFMNVPEYHLIKKEGELPIDDTEQMFLNVLFSEKNEVVISEKKTQMLIRAVLTKMSQTINEQLVARKYYEQTPMSAGKNYFLTGILFIFIGFFLTKYNLAFILSGVIIIIFAFLMSKMTLKGIYAKEDLLGFKQYLEVAEKERIEFHNAPEKKPEDFEQFLPYAILFGVEKKWALQFADIFANHQKNPSWYKGSSPVVNFAQFSNEIAQFGQAGRNALSSDHTGGASRGGGSSGGGGGGGGGRSW